MMNNSATHENCEKCVGGHFGSCIKGKCIHGSTAKSMVGAVVVAFITRKTDGWKISAQYKTEKELNGCEYCQY